MVFTRTGLIRKLKGPSFESGHKAYRYRAETRVPRPTSYDDVRIEIKEELHRFDTGALVMSRDNEVVRLADGAPIKIGIQSPAIPALLSLLAADEPNRRDLQDAFALLSTVRYYPLDEPSHPESPYVIEPDAYAEWLAGYQANPASSHSVPMRLLHLYLAAPQTLEELRQIVGDNDLSILSRIEVQPFEFPSRSKGSEASEKHVVYFVAFVPAGSTESVDYNGLSLGTRRVLRIIASALLDQSTVMLTEQPEDSIHSGLMKKVIGFLRQYSARTQIIMASHSANVFNKMQPEEIRIVYLADGQTRVRALTQKELAAASRYVHDEGPLSEFIQSIDDADSDVWDSR